MFWCTSSLDYISQCDQDLRYFFDLCDKPHQFETTVWTLIHCAPCAICASYTIMWYVMQYIIGCLCCGEGIVLERPATLRIFPGSICLLPYMCGKSTI